MQFKSWYIIIPFGRNPLAQGSAQAGYAELTGKTYLAGQVVELADGFETFTGESTPPSSSDVESTIETVLQWDKAKQKRLYQMLYNAGNRIA